MNIKKSLICLLSLLVVSMAHAAHTRYGVAENASQEYGGVVRAAARLHLSQAEEEMGIHFQQWAKKGDTTAFRRFIEQTQDVQFTSSKTCAEETVLVAGGKDGVCIHPEVALKADGFKNNLLHNARNEETLQSVFELFSVLFSSESQKNLNNLKNEKNVAGETPLLTHIGGGDLDSFAYLYEGSFLQEAAAKIREISGNPSPLVRSTLDIHMQKFEQSGGKNPAGESIVSLVLRSEDSYQRRNVLDLCKEEMPFLF